MTRPIRVAHVTTIDMTLRFLLLGQLRRLRDEGFEVTGISAPGPWTRDLESQGIRHIPWLHATRSWDPYADGRAFLELYRILARERFEIVHTHNPKPGLVGRIAARKAGIPCIVNTVHGLYATREDPALKRLVVLGLERLAVRFSDLELYQSEEDLSWAQRLGVVEASKSVLLGNGADLGRFDPSLVSPERVAGLRSKLGIPEGAIVVGTVGRLVREKGCLELFRAARDVRRRDPRVRFLVVGSPDPMKSDAISQAEMARARDDVTFAGWRDDVRDFFAVMDVFVLASWREGMPRSAIEAAAMGKAMVLTDIRGCREVARDGVEGLLVPPRDPHRLSTAIMRLASSPELRDRLGEAARARALERFDERRVADTVVASYRELLARKGLTRVAADRFRVRAARRSDAMAIARLHRESLPDAFLPALGDGFLLRLYRALANDPDAVLLVAESPNGVVGFASAVRSVPAFYRHFYLRHGFLAALVAAPRLVRPRVLRRVRETVGYPAAMRDLTESELLSIAVTSHWRSRGVGRRLAEGVLRGLADGGVSDVRVVVGADNEEANGFYAAVGFRRVRQVTVHDGRVSNIWVLENLPALQGRAGEATS